MALWSRLLTTLVHIKHLEESDTVGDLGVFMQYHRREQSPSLGSLYTVRWQAQKKKTQEKPKRSQVLRKSKLSFHTIPLNDWIKVVSTYRFLDAGRPSGSGKTARLPPTSVVGRETPEDGEMTKRKKKTNIHPSSHSVILTTSIVTSRSFASYL